MKNNRILMIDFCCGFATILASTPFNILPALLFFSYRISQILNTASTFNIRLFCLFNGFIFAQLHWIVHSTTVDIATFWPVLIIGLIIIPFIGGTIHLLIYNILLKFITHKYIRFFLSIILFEEFVGKILFNGFPWLKFGHFVSFIDFLLPIHRHIPDTLLSITVLYIIFIPFLHLQLKTRIIAIFSSIMILLTVNIFSIATEKMPNLNMMLVQPNISQKDKMIETMYYKNLFQHIDLSIHQKTDIIIWPETAIEYINEDILEIFQNNFENRLLITGTNTIQNYKIFNSAYFIQNGNILYRYHKEYLVPFGEYIPFRNFAPKIVRALSAGAVDFSIPDKQKYYFEYNQYKMYPVICYEVIFAEKIKKRIQHQQNAVIINITNDAWFGNTIGPYQHLKHAKILAVKTNTPVIRVSNNGISAIINNNGKIIQKTSLNIRDVINNC